MMKKFILFIFFASFLFGQTKTFAPLSIETSAGTPIRNATVIAYPAGTTSNGTTLTWLSSGRYYTTSSVTNQIYDFTVSGVSYATNVFWGSSIDITGSGIAVALDTVALKILTDTLAWLNETAVGNNFGEGLFVEIDSVYEKSVGSIYNATSGKQWIRQERLDKPGLVRPEWFGAIADGITDSFSAVRAAAAAIRDNGTLEFGGGHYLIVNNASIRINNVSDLKIIGNGSKLRANVSFDTFEITNNDSSNAEQKRWFTGFDETAFTDVSGFEIKADSSYVRVADSTAWKGLSWWPTATRSTSDSVHVLIEIGAGVEVTYNQGTTFEFSHFGSVGGSQVMYAKRPFLRNQELGTNADITYDSTANRYWIQAVPLENTLTIKDLHFESSRVVVIGYRTVFIQNVHMEVRKEFGDVHQSALVLFWTINSIVDGYSAKGYQQSNSGYGINAQAFINMKILNSNFEDNRHGITTNTLGAASSRGLLVDNCTFTHTPNYTDTFSELNTHPLLDDFKVTNCKFFGTTATPIQLRNGHAIIENVEVEQCTDFLGFQQLEQFKGGSVSIRNSSARSMSGHVFNSSGSGGVNLTKLTIDNFEYNREHSVGVNTNGFLWLSRGSIDTIIIENSRYLGNPTTQNSKMLLFGKTSPTKRGTGGFLGNGSSADSLTSNYIRIKGNFFDNVAALFSAPAVWFGFDHIEVIDNDVVNWNSLFDFNSTDADAVNTVDTVNIGINHLDLRNNRFRIGGKPFSFVGLRVDTLSSFNDEFDTFKTASTITDVVFKVVDFDRGKFINPWGGGNNQHTDFVVFSKATKSLVSITNSTFIRDQGRWEAYRLRRARSGNEAYGAFGGQVSLGEKDNLTYVPDFKFNYNHWEQLGHTVNNGHGWFKSDTGVVEMIGNTITVVDSFNNSELIRITDPEFTFIGNTIKSNAGASKHTIFIQITPITVGKDTVSIFDNRFIDISATPAASSMPISANGVSDLNISKGNNWAMGFDKNNDWGTSPDFTRTLWLMDGLPLKSATDDSIHTITVLGDTLNVSTGTQP